MEQKSKTDLQIFIEKFQPSKYKELKNSIEVRSVVDVERASNKAAELIKSLSLGLVVVRDANTACRGAFEVRIIETSTQDRTWFKPGITGGTGACLCCPGNVDILPIDTRMYQGFGGWSIYKDGELYFEDQTGGYDTAPQLFEFEITARENPDHEWIAKLFLPLREATYQRHDKDKWVLIETGLGFA